MIIIIIIMIITILLILELFTPPFAVWMTASLRKSPGLFLVFWPISTK